MQQKLRPDKNIGGNIARLRYEAGLTQEEMAVKLQIHHCDMSRVTLAKIETNTYNIRISELVAMKKIFKLTSFDPFFMGLEEEV